MANYCNKAPWQDFNGNIVFSALIPQGLHHKILKYADTRRLFRTKSLFYSRYCAFPLHVHLYSTIFIWSLISKSSEKNLKILFFSTNWVDNLSSKNTGDQELINPNGHNLHGPAIF